MNIHLHKGNTRAGAGSVDKFYVLCASLARKIGDTVPFEKFNYGRKNSYLRLDSMNLPLFLLLFESEVFLLVGRLARRGRLWVWVGGARIMGIDGF